MNFTAFKKNLLYSLDTCTNIVQSFKKLNWIYSGNAKQEKIYHLKFKYPSPINEFELFVRNNKGSDYFIFSEVFDIQCYHLPQIDKESVEYVVDLGANIGLSSLFFLKNYPKAKLAYVEPIKSNYDLIVRNLNLNHISATGFNNAISVKNEPILMVLGENDYGHRVIDMSFSKSRFDEKNMMVEGITLNEILEQLHFPKIDLLKIDIEGYEGILFSENTEWLKVTHAIVMEIHGNIDVERIKKILFKYGFNQPEQIKGNYFFKKPND